MVPGVGTAEVSPGTSRVPALLHPLSILFPNNPESSFLPSARAGKPLDGNVTCSLAASPGAGATRGAPRSGAGGLRVTPELGFGGVREDNALA